MKPEMIAAKLETETVKGEIPMINPETETRKPETGTISPVTEAANSGLAVIDARLNPTTAYRKNPAAQYVSKEAAYATTVV